MKLIIQNQNLSDIRVTHMGRDVTEALGITHVNLHFKKGDRLSALVFTSGRTIHIDPANLEFLGVVA